MQLRILLSIFLLIFLSCCSKDRALYEPTIKKDPYKIYKEGLDAFKLNQYFFANKKFSEAEINFTSPDLAAKSAIMSSFSLYGINFYEAAEENLLRYLKTYPADKHVMYAHYLLAIIYYEQIGDEKHDLKPLLDSKKKIDFFIKKYPNSEYTIDLNLKKNLVESQFAARELYIAKYYISVKKWIPAINRLNLIVKKYDKTVFVEEALHRLVEIHYHIGLKNEAKKYAAILGYNYNSSEWFKQSYKVMNKNYKIDKPAKQKENKNFLNKIIEMIK